MIWRAVNRVWVAWALTFTALMAYWEVYEAAEPGTQYADPLLPCVALALWGASLWAVVELARLPAPTTTDIPTNQKERSR